MYIYKVTNLINGLIYIGASTKAVEKSTWYYGSGRGIKKVIKEFGKENFEKEILQECSNIEELHIAERFWIETLDATNPDVGYNMRVVSSDGYFGKQHSETTKSKISDMVKGENHPNFGKPRSEETKSKISENHADVSGENNPMFGKTFNHSEETKLKMSKNGGGKNMTPEERTARAKKGWENRRRNKRDII